MIIKDDTVTFSNGRTEYANEGIIGLSPEMHVYEGYDGNFHRPREDWMTDDDYFWLTTQEQIELADYMIAAWTKFKAEAQKLEK